MHLLAAIAAKAATAADSQRGVAPMHHPPQPSIAERPFAGAGSPYRPSATVAAAVPRAGCRAGAAAPRSTATPTGRPATTVVEASEEATQTTEVAASAAKRATIAEIVVEATGPPIMAPSSARAHLIAAEGGSCSYSTPMAIVAGATALPQNFIGA